MSDHYVRVQFSHQIQRKGLLNARTMGAMFEALPADFKIISWGMDYQYAVDFWIIESNEFPEVSEASILPKKMLKFEEDGGCLRCELVDVE